MCYAILLILSSHEFTEVFKPSMDLSITTKDTKKNLKKLRALRVLVVKSHFSKIMPFIIPAELLELRKLAADTTASNEIL